ncbi:phosphoenolpyruvate--protein phosphotransferase [Treponema vincentii]|uniref:phosphoenolpyruvate--protein phosphotransferase n=1 Tax=Treponema vincentii TaxID=69710 RepID=UPI001BAF8B9A|nr:phosphoenolpyruvate--protein phosphotransferase [Treponema vincentii]QUY18832.1 phosphoenolpyruvate--protein phosphotransferase [Treponema vincentii]
MKKFTGLSVCDGLVACRLVCIPENVIQATPAYAITAENIRHEQERLRIAVQAAQEELRQALTQYRTTNAPSKAPEQAILESHQAMLADEEFMRGIYTEIETSLTNAEAVLKRKLDEVTTMLTASGDSYLCERAVDIQDAYEPVFSHLNPQPKQPPSRFVGVQPDTLLAARVFKPSEVLEIKKLAPCGIIMEEGGATSHIAIMARAWNIPTLIAVQGLMESAKSGMYAVLDSTNGTLILEPDEETVAQIKSAGTEQIEVTEEARDYAQVYTQDGIPVHLSANIVLTEESEMSAVQNTAGIGLFRSEFLFLGDSDIPDEEHQYIAYRTVLERMGSKPVLIRTFDAGADKMLKEQENLLERNALLGWRGIRYCLDRPEVFKPQLRALLRAGRTGNLHILLPMISCKKEIIAVRKLIKEIELECEQNRIPYKKDIPVGIMIEVPSAAIAADLYAPAVDFFSIGTNDLIQYTMAADRENQTIAHLADCFQPAVLRLIRHVIEAEPLLHRTGDSRGGFVSMCGEMASKAEAVPLLLGMGLRRFSMAAQKIPEIAQRIESIRLSDAEALYKAVSRFDSSEEIRRETMERFPL